MPGKKLPNDFFPCTNDLLFTQEGFTFQFCRQLLNNGTKGDRTIGLIIGLGQAAPLFNDAFAKVMMHGMTAFGSRAPGWLVHKKRSLGVSTIPVVADRLNRTPFHCFVAKCLFFGAFRLLV